MSFVHRKAVLLPLFLLLTVLLSSCGIQAISLNLVPMAPAGENMPTPDIIDPGTEVRGVWIAAVYNIDYPSASGLDAAALQAELDGILAACRETGLNTIFFQVRPTCDALYDSAIFPVSSFLSKDGTLVFDPLGYLVEEAHKQNIFVHAWINPLRVTMNSTDVNALPESSPARQHPEWTVPFADGKLYLNAGIPEVRQLVADGVREIVENYDVDGIVFDDYFYPYPTTTANGTPAVFDDAEEFAAYGAGYASLADWRRANINELIRLVYETVHSVDSTCRFGVSPCGVWQNDNGTNGGSATNGFEGYHSLYCDALAWVEAGTVDYLSPQLYWRFTTASAPYDVLVRWWNTVLDGTGVDLYVSHGSYRYEDGEWTDPEGELKEQVTFARSEISYRGSVFYGYDEIRRNIHGAADELRELYQNEIIYSDTVSNGQSVQIATPSSGATMTDAKSYIIGTSDPAYPLSMNGKKIGRTKSGFFSLMADLTPGRNDFTFRHKGEESVYTLYYNPDTGSSQTAEVLPILDSVKITTVYPSQRVTTSGSTQWVSCVAPYGSAVTASLGGTTIHLTMLSEPSRTWDAGGHVGVTYGGTFQLPEAAYGSLQELGNVTFSVSHQAGSASATGGSVRQMGSGAKLAVTVLDRYAELKFSQTSLYYNDYTVQSPGMTDYVVAQNNGFYELRMGGFIAEKWVEETTDYPSDSTKITKAVLSNLGDITELRLTTGDNPAYYGYAEDGKFIVTLYAVDAASAVDVLVYGNPLFTSCETIRLPDQNRVRYALTMQDERNFYGFDLYYDGDDTVVTFRNPMSLDLNREKPLEGVSIVLDAGHGGTDAGAAGAQNKGDTVLNEENLNLAITLEAERLLTELGASVSLIRREDVTVSLQERMRYLEEAEPDLCISIHQNSMGYAADITRIRGVLPLYCADAGKLLADTVGAGVANRTGRQHRESQYQMLALCRNPKFPQALIEVGFITCVEEYEQMVNGSGILQAAEGIAEGVLEYFRRQAEYAG